MRQRSSNFLARVFYITSWRGVALFATVTTVFAIALANVITYFSYEPDFRARTVLPTIWTTFLTALPICVFIGYKIRETTLLKNALQRMVNRDRLTDLATREYFFDRVAEVEGEPGVVLMVDIDHFKRINDTFGHLVGDRVIVRVAQVLDASTRETDVTARFGGEEFVVFLRDVTADTGALVAERMRGVIEQSDIRYNGEPVAVSASIGVAELRPGVDLDAAIKAADDALYAAKRAGRNRVSVAPPVVAEEPTQTAQQTDA